MNPFQFNCLIIEFKPNVTPKTVQRVVLQNLERQIAAVSMDKEALNELELELKSLTAYVNNLQMRNV